MRQLCTVFADLVLLRLLAIALARLLLVAFLLVGVPLLFDFVSVFESDLDSARLEGDRDLAGLLDGDLLCALFSVLLLVFARLFVRLLGLLLLLESPAMLPGLELGFLRADVFFRSMSLITLLI